MPRACLFPASSAWVAVIKSLLPFPQALPCSRWYSKPWGTVNSHQLRLGVCADSLRGIPGAVSTTLCTPLFFFFFLSLVKELSGLFGDAVAFTEEARGREKETSPIHSPS